MKALRLGINIDHVATLRNARGGLHPDPLRAAGLAMAAGADQITAHLREDRRHINDTDMERLAADIAFPLNMEMAATDEMVEIALRLKPEAICLVPERREEVTTEGGLDVIAHRGQLRAVVDALFHLETQVHFFVDPDLHQLDMAKELGVHGVELHTGAYSDARGAMRQAELTKLARAAAHGAGIGLQIHAGHGLDYDNVADIARLPQIEELNIGHHLMGEAMFVGLENAVRRMRLAMDAARDEISSAGEEKG